MSRVRFVITGFSSFPGVESNPTEKLVQWVNSTFIPSDKLADSPVPITIESAEVLKVAAQTVDAWMDNFFSSHAEPAADEVVVLVHLGVHAQAVGIQLEAQAVNDADFRVPDQDGWQPEATPINPAEPITSCICTDLDLPECCGQLHSQGCNLLISRDAGRYICNWIYYRSLQQTADKSNMHSLFIHVPPFSVVPEASQRQVLVAILQALAVDLIAPSTATVDERVVEEVLVAA